MLLGNDSSYVKHSHFENNTNAMSNYTGWVFPVDSCKFINNTTGISDGTTKYFTSCIFENNGIAIDAWGVRVINSFFQYNGTAITDNGGSGWNIRVIDCVIINNNIGIAMTGDTILNNFVSDNSYGLKIGHTSYNYNGIQYYVPIKFNQICNNSVCNVENISQNNMNITQNCFCDDDSASIEAKLKDGYDDISLGLFNYDIYDTTCQTVIQTVYKIGSPPSSVNSIISENNLFTVFPNPVIEDLTIVFNNRIKTSSEICLYNSVGEKIISSTNNQNAIFWVNLNNLPNGLYLLEVTQEKIVKKEKIIKL